MLFCKLLARLWCHNAFKEGPRSDPVAVEPLQIHLLCRSFFFIFFIIIIIFIIIIVIIITIFIVRVFYNFGVLPSGGPRKHIPNVGHEHPY